MADLLTHVLVAYSVGTLLATRYTTLSSSEVAVITAGALLPDLDHVAGLLPPSLIAETLGVQFSWTFLQTGGGVLLTTLASVLVVAPQYRRQAFGLLWLGAGTHLIMDALLYAPDGRSQSLFWPLTQYKPPTPGLYMSTDLWPVLVAGLIAIASTFFARYSNRTAISEQRRW